MKKFIAVAVLAGLATAAFAQSQIDASINVNAPDLNAAKVNKLTTAGDQKSKKAFNLDTNVKFTQTFKLDDANTVKAGAAIDLYTPFFSGNVDPYKSQLAAKVIEPFVQYQGFGVDAQTSVAVYAFTPADTASGSAAVGYYTGPLFSAKKPAKDNTVPVSDYLKVSYKYSFDKTMAVVAGVETDTALVPVLYLIDIKPQASFIYLMTQTDVKYNLTFSSSNYDDTGASTTANTTKSYVEPKFTFDFGGLDASMKGFKAYTTGKFMVANVAVTNGNSTTGKLTGSRWDNGVAYSYTVKDVGTFGGDAYVRVGGIGPDDVSDNTQVDFNLKLTYQIKF